MGEATSGDRQSSACPHPEAVGNRWGDSISAERQGELQAILDAWNAPGADHGERKGAFDQTGLSDEEQERRRLTGAEVFWLAERVHNKEAVLAKVPDLHLEGAHLRQAHLETLYVNTL